MTREDILAMPAGRELDALVAEKVMGWYDICPMTNTSNNFTTFQGFPPGIYSRRKVNNYSTNISAAWEVVEKIGKLGWMLYKLAHTLSGKGEVDGYVCIYLHIESGASREVISDAAPEAICKAALLTVLEESL